MQTLLKHNQLLNAGTNNEQNKKTIDDHIYYLHHIYKSFRDVINISLHVLYEM